MRLPRAPVAGVRSAEPPATGVGMVTRLARAWATWIQHGQCDVSRRGCQKTHPRLGVAVAAQVCGECTLCTGGRCTQLVLVGGQLVLGRDGAVGMGVRKCCHCLTVGMVLALGLTWFGVMVLGAWRINVLGMTSGAGPAVRNGLDLAQCSGMTSTVREDWWPSDPGR